MMQYSPHVQNVEGRENLDPWILVLVVEYLLSTSFCCVLTLDCNLGPIRGCVLSAIININCPYGAIYFQTVYAPKCSLRRA